MPIPYPTHAFGRFRLGLAFTYRLLHERFGFDLGERYHRDLDYRIQTTMEIDRAVFEVYGKLGLGYEKPFPRASIEPFGHRFMPAIYGCQIGYSPGEEPWAKARGLSEEEILALPPWTPEQFPRSEPVRLVAGQIEQLKRRHGQYRVPPREFNPHYRAMSAVQNLGSAINTALSVQGQDLLLGYATAPETVRKFYANIAQLMLLAMDYFSGLDGWPPADVFVGNCTVAMISPAQYAACNETHDRRLIDYARKIGARFTMHQDSNVNPHLEHYARLDYLHGLDVGQDTDFAKAGRLFPHTAVNCILFPAWLESHTRGEVREELMRIMALGKQFPAFSFTLLEIDAKLDGQPLLDFLETFRECAAANS